MQGGITPGASIDSFESPLDAEIPLSPSFAHQAKEIPHFDISDDDDELKNHGTQVDQDDEDELKASEVVPQPVNAAPDDPNSVHACNLDPNLRAPNLSNLSNFSNSGGHQTGKLPGAGIANWAFGNSTEPPTTQAVNPQRSSNDRQTGKPNPVYDAGNLPELMPPWLQEIRDNFSGLHNKADRQHQDILAFGAEVQAQGIRVSQLEQVANEHTLKHESTEARLKTLEQQIRQDNRDEKIRALERKILELQEGVALSDERERSPRRTGLGTRTRSPSPRSPRFQSRQSDGSSTDGEDLDIVIGGWNDARKNDAIDEAKNIFQIIGCESSIGDIFVPYSRTNFAKIKLLFPQPEAHISVRRQFQFGILDKLRNRAFTSGVPGSTGNKIWATKSKTPEERAKIRAIVLTKTFYKTLSPGTGKPCFSDEDIEIAWNGKVYIENFQLLGSVLRDGEPAAEDVCIEDAKGNHMNWYLKADIFQQVTNKPAEQLQELWLSQGPTSAHTRAFN